MYNEEKSEKNYFFRDLIVKILLVLLFIFLLMWLLPMPNLNPVLDKIFAQNINNMTEAAKGYFTTSRLPSKEGEIKTLTLKEMIDNKMLIEFTDSDGKTCNLNKSYVEVTKKEGEYIFKTNLSCSTQEDYVIEYFGCYDVCVDDSCKEKPTVATENVTEYRFYKINTEKLIDKYVCKEGYKLSGTKCVLETTTETKEAATLKCLTGYTYNESIKMCEKEDVEIKNAYKSCPKGYIYATSMDKCIKLEDNVKDATLTYICDKGTLNENNKCEVSATKEVDATKVYSCDEGTLSGTKCKITKSATPVYSCPEGTLTANNKCSVQVKNPEICSYTNWTCSNITTTYQMGVSSTPTSTTKFLYKNANGTYVYQVCTRRYSCVDGGTTTVVKDIAVISSYKCSEGTLSGTKCITTKSAELTYKCSEGTLSGTKCITTKSAKLTYKCSEGTLSGTKCKINSTNIVEPIKEYSCNEGILDGTKCIVGEVVSTNYTYKCSIGTLNGNKCYIYTNDKVEPTYLCEEGYTKVGTSCYKTTSSTDIYNAEAKYKTVSNKVYKWSKSETLNGWTRTGETRTATVAITSK